MEGKIQELRKTIKNARRADSFMLAVLIVLALTIPLCIVVGNWLNAFCSCLWLYTGCRWYKMREDTLDSNSEAFELIKAQDILIDKLVNLLSESSKGQPRTEEEKKEG